LQKEKPGAVVTVDRAGAVPVRDRAKDKVADATGAVVITGTIAADKEAGKVADKDRITDKHAAADNLINQQPARKSNEMVLANSPKIENLDDTAYDVALET
jgi:hypothetical protein